ncbi:hypothetical protein HanRHA438_Chr06g0255731 [Helianthus annuus]|nr:hypothetical protein HanRHA438_Chr06g0255731 [Helianthus annuus]
MATSPHSNPEVAGSSLARSQCPYGTGFTPRLRLAGWRSARWDHLGGWEDRGISPPPLPQALLPPAKPRRCLPTHTTTLDFMSNDS